MSRGNTTTLWRHLEKSHEHDHKHLKTVSFDSSQPTSLHMFKKTEVYKKDATKKKRLDLALISMVAMDMQPLSIVEDKGFIAFCKELNEKYQLPTRKTLRSVHLPALFSKTLRKIREQLQSVEKVCITTDLWTSNNNVGYGCN